MKRTFLSLLIVSLLTVTVGTTATKRIVKPPKTVLCVFIPDEEMIVCFDDGQ